jgi:hypothetical protein
VHLGKLQGKFEPQKNRQPRSERTDELFVALADEVKEQILRDGKRTFIYEQPRTGDVFAITDPGLHLDQLEAVQRDVAQLLEHGLNPPPAAPEPVAAVAETPPPAGEPAPAI